MRQERLAALKGIIRRRRIASQEGLVAELSREGFSVTQATLSRDLRALKVIKVSDEREGYFYALPAERENRGAEAGAASGAGDIYREDLKRGILSFDVSLNLGVVKTLPGHANSVAMALDNLGHPEILGTLAGDDTIIIVMRETASKEALSDFFRPYL